MNFVKNSINFNLGGKSAKTENDAIAPNGVKEASKFFAPSSVGSTTFSVLLNPITFVTDKIYCRSIFVKPVSNNPQPILIPFLIGGTDPEARWGYFNIITKTFTWGLQGGSTSEIGSIFTANYKEYDNGWIRVWWNIKKTSTNTLGLNDYHMGGYGGGNNGSMWVWGAQVETVDSLLSEPSDYEAVGISSQSTFYNRDSNINVTNPITALTYYPSYGSRVTFSSNLNKYETSDGYYNLVPLSVNSLKAEFDLKYDLNEEEAQKLVNFIENKNGVNDITFSDPSFLYKNIDGFCSEYAINHINKNHYEVALSLEVNESPNLFNWYSMNFININYATWDLNKNFNKYDIVYYNNPKILNNLFKKSENFREKNWYFGNTKYKFHKDTLNPFGKYEAYSIKADVSTNEIWHGFHPVKYLNGKYIWSDFFDKVPAFAKKMTFSIFIKPNAKFRFLLGIEYAASKNSDANTKTYNYVSFNLSSLTSSTWSGNAIGRIIEYPNGWYRCIITSEVQNEYFIPILVLLNNDGTKHEYAAPSNDGSLYIWGAQVQEELTDYIKTDSYPILLNKLNNFYYSSSNHNSLDGINKSPDDSLSPWRQDFFFEPDIGIQNSVNLKVSKLNLRNSFSQNIKTQKNIATLNLTYKFSNITTKKAKAILHFLENKGGYRRFRIDIDSIYNKAKVFYAPSWTHTWKYEDSHDIEVELIEDPMGVIPKD